MHQIPGQRAHARQAHPLVSHAELAVRGLHKQTREVPLIPQHGETKNLRGGAEHGRFRRRTVQEDELVVAADGPAVADQPPAVPVFFARGGGVRGRRRFFVFGGGGLPAAEVAQAQTDEAEDAVAGCPDQEGETVLEERGETTELEQYEMRREAGD
jgi:hypothetical protein